MRKIIIYDSDHPGAFQNKCFEEDYANQGPGHGLTVELAVRARAAGFEIVTGDIFLEMECTDATAFCISDMYSSKTNRILRKGAIPFMCVSTESPIIARNFYINIRKLAGRFIHNIQFRGTERRLSGTSTQFSTMYIPMDRRVPLPSVKWSEKKFLVMINRNKRMFYGGSGTVLDKIRSGLSRASVAFKKLRDPWIRSKEIYKDRIEAIYYFSKCDGFHLYGQGWENAIPGFSMKYQRSAKRVFQGSLKSTEKLAVMSQYKYSICFENCMFPGYVTEKIFDCFLSSCIPVYFGAPDILDFVPRNTFIDYRNFRNFEELEKYLVGLNETDAAKMLDSAKVFLASSEYDKYCSWNIAEKILDRIHAYKN
jgi:Glycosyltransferase family 10 (fucosyltransferase) C-term